VKALGDTGVLTGLIETDGEYRGRPVGGRFRFTKVFTKDPEGWRCVAWQNTPIIETAPDPGSVRAVYEEVCREHAGITDFRGKLLGLLPLASGAGILLLLSGKDPLPPAKMHYLAPFGFLGALVALGLYFYELRGIQVCKVLREHAKHLELAFLLPAGVEGAFSGRPKALGGYVGAEGAGHIVYLAVIGAWGYVAELGWCAEREAWMCSRPSMGPALFVIAALVTTQLLSRLVPRRTLPRVR